MEILNYVAGEFVSSQSQESFEKISPFTGEVLAKVTCSSAMDFIFSLQHSKKAAAAFKDSSLEERAALLEKIAQAISESETEIAYQEALHQGLSASFVLKNGVRPAIAHFTANAQSLRAEQSPELYSAVGVVGIVASWCLSLKLISERLAPALAAGNAVIIKVSEQSPVTGKILAEALSKAGVPAGLVTILQGKKDLAELLAGHPGIAAIAAVGSQAMLESLAKSALGTLKKVQLSGANKGASIVLNGFAYQDRMADLFESFLMGQGQMCWNSTRLFILESFAKEFISDTQDYFNQLKPLLDPSGAETWSPVINADVQARTGKSLALATSEMGKVHNFSDRLPVKGFYVQPHFVLDLPNCSALQQDDLQSPALLITSVKYQHEFVKWANTGYLAHSSVVWGPEEKLDKVVRGLEFERVWKNRWLNGDTATVLGMKQSFYGNPELNWQGRFYSNVKTLTT